MSRADIDNGNVDRVDGERDAKCVRKKFNDLSVIAFSVFALHVIIWILVCSLLFVINAVSTFLLPPWFLFPTLGWGIGVVVHGAITIAIIAFLGDNFRELCEAYVPKYINDFVREKVA